MPQITFHAGQKSLTLMFFQNRLSFVPSIVSYLNMTYGTNLCGFRIDAIHLLLLIMRGILSVSVRLEIDFDT